MTLEQGLSTRRTPSRPGTPGVASVKGLSSVKSSIRTATVSGMAVLAMLGVTACNATATAENGKPASSSAASDGTGSASPSPTPTTDPVVFRPGSSTTLDDVQAYVKERLAAYKYPRRIWTLGELPKGPTGKILRREVRPADAS